MRTGRLPTKSVLNKLLNFNAINGEITWKVSRGGVKAGSQAGYVITTTCGQKYINIMINEVNYYAHRLMWYYHNNTQPIQIDHKNGNGLDNRLVNLRPATNKINANNMKKRIDNTSGIIGVSYDKSRKCWQAYYGTSKCRKTKRFDDFFEAVCCRKSWENQYGMTELKKHRKD